MSHIEHIRYRYNNWRGFTASSAIGQSFSLPSRSIRNQQVVNKYDNNNYKHRYISEFRSLFSKDLYFIAFWVAQSSSSGGVRNSDHVWTD